jgi:hypothetical protein
MPVTAALQAVHIMYHQKKFVLRGVIAFNAPNVEGLGSLANAALGHYYCYSRRVGGKWMVLDDLAKKITHVSQSTILATLICSCTLSKINLHTLRRTKRVAQNIRPIVNVQYPISRHLFAFIC